MAIQTFGTDTGGTRIGLQVGGTTFELGSRRAVGAAAIMSLFPLFLDGPRYSSTTTRKLDLTRFAA